MRDKDHGGWNMKFPDLDTHTYMEWCLIHQLMNERDHQTKFAMIDRKNEIDKLNRKTGKVRR